MCFWPQSVQACFNWSIRFGTKNHLVDNVLDRTYRCWAAAEPSCRGTPPGWPAEGQTPGTGASSGYSAHTWWTRASGSWERGGERGREGENNIAILLAHIAHVHSVLWPWKPLGAGWPVRAEDRVRVWVMGNIESADWDLVSSAWRIEGIIDPPGTQDSCSYFLDPNSGNIPEIDLWPSRQLSLMKTLDSTIQSCF